jgi:hypothetical protein
MGAKGANLTLLHHKWKRYVYGINSCRTSDGQVHVETMMTNSGQLAQTGVSWPISLVVGLLTAGVGAVTPAP